MEPFVYNFKSPTEIFNEKLDKATRDTMEYLAISEDETKLFEPLREFIKTKYNRLKCVVMWERSSDWREFCENNSIDFGKQEIIITDMFHVIYYSDYRSRKQKK